MNISGVEIGSGHPCRFVAEISNNHNGSLERALRLIDAAKASGASFVKFQCYSPSELVALRGDGPAPEPWGSQGWTMRTLYEKARTPFEWFPTLAAHCERMGIPWFSSVFGAESLAILDVDLGCPAYKIARLDNQHDHLRQWCVATRKPVLVSVGEPPDRFAGCEYLYCPPGYPTLAADVHLPVFDDRPHEPWFFGLSSHCMDPLLPIAAVARGCKLIEMHFQLDDEQGELEANVSLTASQFAQMVQDVRRVEGMLA